MQIYHPFAEFYVFHFSSQFLKMIFEILWWIYIKLRLVVELVSCFFFNLDPKNNYGSPERDGAEDIGSMEGHFTGSIHSSSTSIHRLQSIECSPHWHISPPPSSSCPYSAHCSSHRFRTHAYGYGFLVSQIDIRGISHLGLHVNLKPKQDKRMTLTVCFPNKNRFSFFWSLIFHTNLFRFQTLVFVQI